MKGSLKTLEKCKKCEDVKWRCTIVHLHNSALMSSAAMSTSMLPLKVMGELVRIEADNRIVCCPPSSVTY